jgi:hypothetical protein
MRREAVKTKSSTERDRKILASVKREMDRPRLTASVRDALEAAVLAARTFAVHSAKA